MTMLSSLVRAYERMENRPEFGWAEQNVQFFLEINDVGEAVGGLTAFGYDKRRLIDRAVVIPYFGGRSGSVAPPYFLWDNSAYVLGVTAKELFDAPKRHLAFRDLHLRALAKARNPALRALRSFLEGWKPEAFAALGFPEDAKDRNIVFRYSGERCFVHEHVEAAEIWKQIYNPDTIGEGMCLVTGTRGQIARLHPPIKSFENPARIVSFDKDNDAFSSYGHLFAENAPTRIEAAFQYTAVLNRYLDRGSRNRIQIGDASTVFWADAEAQAAEMAEAWAGFMFGNRAQTGETEKIAEARIAGQLAAIAKGRSLYEIAPELDQGVRFHVLGLAPNAARLSVRFYWEDSFGALAQHYADWMRDVSMAAGPPPGLSIRAAVLRTAPAQIKDRQVKFDADGISPLLAGELFRAILTGGRLPRSLLGQILLRIRSDSLIDRIRIALIKAVIVRSMRMDNRLPLRPDGSVMEDYLVNPDPDDPNTARRLGRLFALIERAQAAALGDGINATVADKFLGAAAATPRRAFPPLLRAAKDHHIKRLRNGHSDADWLNNPKKADGKTPAQRARAFGESLERRIGELWMSMPDGPPEQHSSEEQGLFLVGYYQEKYAKRGGASPEQPDTETIASEEE